MYEVEFTKNSVKELKSIDKEVASQIMKKIKRLSIDPYDKNLDIKKLRGIENLYMLRIRDYRVIYEISNRKLLVTVIKIGNRGGIYG